MEKFNPKNWTAVMTNRIIFLLGVVAVLLSVILGIEKIFSMVLISVGASLIASSVVTGISSKYLSSQNQKVIMIEKWGLNGVFRTRSEINVITNEILKKADSLDICAMGLKGFRDAQAKVIAQRVKAGMKLRILTIKPTSDVLSEIDRLENNVVGSTKGTIETLEEWIGKLQKQQLCVGQVQLREYNHYPYEFYFNIDGYIFVGPYQNKSSQQTITYAFDKFGEGAKYYSEYFDELWESSNEVTEQTFTKF